MRLPALKRPQVDDTRLKGPLYGAKLTAKVARSAAVPGHELPITTGS